MLKKHVAPWFFFTSQSFSATLSFFLRCFQSRVILICIQFQYSDRFVECTSFDSSPSFHLDPHLSETFMSSTNHFVLVFPPVIHVISRTVLVIMTMCILLNMISSEISLCSSTVRSVIFVPNFHLLILVLISSSGFFPILFSLLFLQLFGRVIDSADMDCSV